MVPFKNFERLLKERNTTMYRVSKNIKLSTSMMSNWKMGRSSPSVESLVKLSKYFNVPITYFIDERTSDN